VRLLGVFCCLLGWSGGYLQIGMGLHTYDVMIFCSLPRYGIGYIRPNEGFEAHALVLGLCVLLSL
jgi:hypothetical protein